MQQLLVLAKKYDRKTKSTEGSPTTSMDLFGNLECLIAVMETMRKAYCEYAEQGFDISLRQKEYSNDALSTLISVKMFNVNIISKLPIRI